MRREWLQVVLVVVVVLALMAVEGAFRCAVQIDSRPTDAGTDPWGAVRNQPNGSACQCETPSGMRIVGQGVDPL